jgi:hypothetical protein
MPLPTMRTAFATSSALQSLEMKPAAPAALAASGEIQPAPEISRTRVFGEASLAELRAGSLAEDAVDQRDVGPTASGELDRLLRRRGHHAVAHPRLAPQQQPEAPLHDGVIVHHEHAELLGAV